MADSDGSINGSAPAARRFLGATAVAFAAVIGLIGLLGYLVFERAHWFRQADEANLREWLDEARVFRKSLPELMAELLRLHDQDGLTPADGPVVTKRREILEQFSRLADPTRIYQNQLPLFPDIYLLELTFPGTGWDSIVWRSPLPRPRGQAVNDLVYQPVRGDPRVVLRCIYRTHAYTVEQRAADTARARFVWVVAVVAGLGLLAAYLAWRQENEKIGALQEKEHTARSAFEKEKRAAEIEKRAAQQFAAASVAAGSYAHNIKNLLVRPNDLLARCLDTDAIPPTQRQMLVEVRRTLATVTERLQQILQTVRQESHRSERTTIDAGELVRSLVQTWSELASDKWKLDLAAEIPDEPLAVHGDRSHLTQMLENLLFNARDATFEYRNLLRESARQAPEDARRRLLLEAAGWRGRVVVRARAVDGRIALEVADNGIGMTPEVLRRCTEIHFSTKRDNALFEGLNTGSGLGLSFVNSVAEGHGANLTVESRPREGTTFRLTFPPAEPDRQTERPA
jgi:signal transduction histidine kinase